MEETNRQDEELASMIEKAFRKVTYPKKKLNPPE